jgi:hypothetical protein
MKHNPSIKLKPEIYARQINSQQLMGRYPLCVNISNYAFSLSTMFGPFISVISMALKKQLGLSVLICNITNQHLRGIIMSDETLIVCFCFHNE